jgi:hypothetical protein
MSWCSTRQSHLSFTYSAFGELTASGVANILGVLSSARLPRHVRIVGARRNVHSVQLIKIEVNVHAVDWSRKWAPTGRTGLPSVGAGCGHDSSLRREDHDASARDVRQRLGCRQQHGNSGSVRFR